MRVQAQLKVPASPEHAWRQLLDLPGLMQCLPGFQLRRSGSGTHAGELTTGYKGAEQRRLGRLRAIDADADALIATIGIDGRELGGPGIASGLLIASVSDDAGASRLLLSADVNLVGHRAGADTVRDDGQRLIDDFAAALGRRMSRQPAPTPVSARAPLAAEQPRDAVPESDVLDLGSVLGGSLGRRYGAVGALLMTLTLLLREVVLRRRPRGVSLTIRYRW